ncbi:MAG: hypothetical protein KDK26_11655 [Roseivivax sp.]|nr:hypothetical protein [Roseivivax sp.]
MSAAAELLFPGAVRAMPDTVDYRFVNGWVATGDLPCREALRDLLPYRRNSCPEGPFNDLVIGFDGRDMDFSRFCHRPTLITRGLQCLIRGDQGLARFRVRTCGGVRLWTDGQGAAAFEPFERNRPAETEVDLALTGAPQVLTLRLEDLHERDTTCFFSLELLAGQNVQVALPEGFDAAAVQDAARVLGSLRTDRVFYSGAEGVRLCADHAPSSELALTVQGPAQFGRGGLTLDPEAHGRRDVRLSPARADADLGPAGDLPAGCLSIAVEARVAGARLSRQLGTTVLRSGVRLGKAWRDRQAQALGIIAGGGGFEASVALCLAARGEQPERMVRVIEACLGTIEERFDCSDFTILPLLRLFRDHASALPGPLRERMKSAFLGYRYWMDEPGNDVMWFWSENHVLCFHAAQLIAGGLFPDLRFAASGRTGAEQAALATARLDRWFGAVQRDGLCEWNSAAYYPIDLLGLLSLHDMAPAFRSKARDVIDRVLVMAALHTLGGVPAGVQGRCYEKELLAGPHTELGSLMAMVLGGSFEPGYDRAAALLALSDYVPPDGMDKAAAPPEGRVLRAAYVQGHGGAGRLSLWKTSQAQLSTSRPLAPGSEGHQAQVLDVQLGCHPLARLWINHPGETRPWGERRPSLLAGNHVTPAVAQDGPDALMIYDLRRGWTDLHRTQLFAAPGAVGAPRRCGAWLVFADCVAVWCSVPLRAEQTGVYRDALWYAEADQMAWALSLRGPSETLAAFLARQEGRVPAFAKGRVTMPGHAGVALALDRDGVFLRDGREVPFGPVSTIPHLAWDTDALQTWEDWHDRA